MALLTSTTTTAVRDPSAASFGDEKASVFTNSTTEMAIHALRKDEDGLLYYTKVKLNSNDDITMAAGGLAYSGLSDIVANQFKDGTPVNDTNPTEGETGFSNVVKKVLESNSIDEVEQQITQSPIDGCISRNE